MTIQQFMGGTAPRVDTKGDGSHVPLVQIDGNATPTWEAASKVIDAQGNVVRETQRMVGTPTTTRTRTITYSVDGGGNQTISIGQWA